MEVWVAAHSQYLQQHKPQCKQQHQHQQPVDLPCQASQTKTLKPVVALNPDHMQQRAQSCTADHSRSLCTAGRCPPVFGVRRRRAWMMSPASRLYRRLPSARSHSMATPSCTTTTHHHHRRPGHTQCQCRHCGKPAGSMQWWEQWSCVCHAPALPSSRLLMCQCFITTSLLFQAASRGLRPDYCWHQAAIQGHRSKARKCLTKVPGVQARQVRPGGYAALPRRHDEGSTAACEPVLPHLLHQLLLLILNLQGTMSTTPPGSPAPPSLLTRWRRQHGLGTVNSHPGPPQPCHRPSPLNPKPPHLATAPHPEP